MGKRSKTDKPTLTMANRLQRFKATCAAVGRFTLRVTYFSLWLGLAGGSIYGLYWCRDYALELPQYKKPVTIRLKEVPSWLQLPGNQHVREQILQAARIDPKKDFLADDSVAWRVACNLATCKWIEQVVSVRKEHDGVLWVECKYRLPTAWVQQNDTCYLVDRQGVRLPGEYKADHIAGTNMPIIMGVAAAPPEIGQPWGGEDMQAGLKQATILPKRVREQIAAIDVSNYDGRKNPQASDIKLITLERESEIYWGHAPGEEYERELTAASKIRLLEDNLARYQRIDANRAYLDIRTAPVFQPAERSASDGLSGNRAVARVDPQ